MQSRYYNPEVGRFLNGDSLNSTGQGFIGNNMFAYCLNNPVNYCDGAGTRCVQVKPLGGGAKKKDEKANKGQDTAEKITYVIFESWEAVLDGIEAELAIGMGFGGTVSASVEGINISADLFVTTKLALVIDDGMVDLRSISSYGAGVPLAEYLGVDTVKGVSHSLFDPKCTCHFNSSWKDFYECAANQPFSDVSTSLGVSAGGYFVIGGEVALGYDLQAFADSAQRVYESAF